MSGLFAFVVLRRFQVHRKRFLAHVGIASLVGMAGLFGAERSAPSLLGAQSRSRRFDEPENKEPTVEELKSQLAAATKERDDHKTERDRLAGENKTTSEKLKTFEDGQKTELQKAADDAKLATDRATKAESRAQETALRLEIERAARKLNVVDEDTVYQLLDKSAIKFGDDGKPTGVTEALEALVKAKPFLIASEGEAGIGTGAASNPARNRGGGNVTASDIVNADFTKSGRTSPFKI